MSSREFARAKQIVAEALEHSIGLRGAYLDEACRDDAELRAEVESLLAQDVSGVPSLLATAGLGAAIAPELLNELGRSSRSPPGRRIGAYEIIAILGEGGMGTSIMRAKPSRSTRSRPQFNRAGHGHLPRW